MTEQAKNQSGEEQPGALLAGLPTDRLVHELEGFVRILGERALQLATDKVGEATERLTSYAEGSGSPAGKAAAKGARALGQGKSPLRALMSAGVGGLTGTITQALGGGGGGGGGSNDLKVTNIVEQIDVGVPVDVAYNAWTQFQDFPSFMKKVENVEQEEDAKLTWKAQVFWSHRNWRATITEQVPDRRIIWKSEGDKGYVDGAVTFHEIAPELTRILVVLEYHPQGFFEKTGNIWRAQGRRVRLELKHYRRYVMTEVILHPDEVEGWRGEIRDGEVVRADGEEGQPGSADDEQAQDEDRSESTGSDDEASDEYDEDEGDDEASDEDDDQDDDDASDEYDEDEDEGDEDEGDDEAADEYDDEDDEASDEDDEDDNDASDEYDDADDEYEDEGADEEDDDEEDADEEDADEDERPSGRRKAAASNGDRTPRRRRETAGRG